MKQKLLLLFISIVSCCMNTYGQDNSYVAYWIDDGNGLHSTDFFDKNGNKIDVSVDCIIVMAYENKTWVNFTVHSKDGEKNVYFWPGPHTYIQYCDNRLEIKEMSFKQYDLKRDKPVNWIWEGEKMKFSYSFSGVIPAGISFDIIDPDKGIPNFSNYATSSCR